MARPYVDLTGRKFGDLVVQGRAGPLIGRNSLWLCSCACGNSKLTVSALLQQGRVRSCGCWKTPPPSAKTHGLGQEPEYHVWYGMMQRCYNERHISYPRYGGRGVKVCKKWQSVKLFFRDMCPRPSPMHKLERIDNDGNYTRKNCTWVTAREQSMNRVNSVHVTWRGETHVVREWERILGMTGNCIRQRLVRGWTIERAMTEPA